MDRKKLLISLSGACAMVVLILDGKTALEGAREGVILCLMTVVPSLFPFFLLSLSLTDALLGVPHLPLGPLAAFLGLPAGAEALVVTTLAGGYPAGAKGVAQGVDSGHLSREQGEKLLPVCNQPGPAFLFGMVGPLFPKKWMVLALWAIVLLSAGMTRLLLSPPKARRVSQAPSPPPGDALWRSIKAMASICGWVVLFRVVLAFLSRWCLWLLPWQVQVGLIGAMELSNGCVLLGQVADLRLRFCLAAGMLSFGGLCIAMQTRSVSGGLSMKYYLPGKLLQTMIALSFCLLVAYGIWMPLVVVFLAIGRMEKKRCGNLPLLGV